MEQKNSFFLYILFCIIFCSCDKSNYKVDIVSVETLCDSSGYGPLDVTIKYEINNLSNNAQHIEEIYQKKCCLFPLDDSIYVLKSPCLVYKRDTIYGQHTRKKNVHKPNTKLVLNSGVNRFKIVFNSIEIYKLYDKYSQGMNESQFLKEFTRNSFFIYEIDRKIFEVKIDKDIVYFNYNGEAMEFDED